MKDYVSPKNINNEVGMHRRISGRIIRSFFAFSGIRPDNPVFFAISGVRPDNPFFFAISGIRPDNPVSLLFLVSGRITGYKNCWISGKL